MDLLKEDADEDPEETTENVRRLGSVVLPLALQVRGRVSSEGSSMLPLPVLLLGSKDIVVDSGEMLMLLAMMLQRVILRSVACRGAQTKKKIEADR